MPEPEIPEQFDEGEGGVLADAPPPTEGPSDPGGFDLPGTDFLPGMGEEFEAFDPTTVRQAPSEETPLVDEQGNRLPTFDVRHRDDFEGLLYIGSLSRRFFWLGHQFHIRTLNVDEMLAVTRVTSDYDQSMGAGLAYKTAMSAMAVVSIDGQELPIPVGAENDIYAWAHQRFDYAREKWFSMTIDAIYAEYLTLEEKAAAVVTAMGKALGPTG